MYLGGTDEIIQLPKPEISNYTVTVHMLHSISIQLKPSIGPRPRGIHHQIYVHYFCLLESNKTSLIDMKFVSVVIGVIILKT